VNHGLARALETQLVNSVMWTHAAERVVVDDDLLAIDHTEARLLELDARLAEIAETEEASAPKVPRERGEFGAAALRGICKSFREWQRRTPPVSHSLRYMPCSRETTDRCGLTRHRAGNGNFAMAKPVFTRSIRVLSLAALCLASSVPLLWADSIAVTSGSFDFGRGPAASSPSPDRMGSF
jgi:hypothetical protein